MKIRKLITCFTALAVASGMLAACGDSKTSADNGEAAEGGAGAQEILLVVISDRTGWRAHSKDD